LAETFWSHFCSPVPELEAGAELGAGVGEGDADADVGPDVK
jgi:hypothetical protein